MIRRGSERDLLFLGCPSVLEFRQFFEERLLVILPIFPHAQQDFFNEHFPSRLAIRVQKAAPQTGGIITYGRLMAPDRDDGAGVAPVI